MIKTLLIEVLLSYAHMIVLTVSTRDLNKYIRIRASSCGLGCYPYVLTNKDGEDEDKYYAEFTNHTLSLVKMQELIDDETLPGYGNKSDVACNIITEMLAGGKSLSRRLLTLV